MASDLVDIPAARPRSPRHRRGWLGGVTLLVLLLTAGVSLLPRTPSELPGIARDPAPDIAELTFVDHSDPSGAREVDLIPAEGELTLLYFGYLSCPDICPLTMVDIAQAQREIGPDLAARTTVAFVTVDPDRDDPERLRSYMSHFFPDRHLALTPVDRPSLDAAAGRLGVRYEIEPHADGDQDYDVAHTAVTYVIDDHGVVVRELPYGVTSEDFAQVMRALL